MTARLQFDRVGRSWPRVGWVVQDVTLQVAAGEVVALVGPSGGGKSTLLLMAAGLVAPSTGNVSVGGKPAVDVAVGSPGRVGYVAADAGLYPLLTGWENLEFFAGLSGTTGVAVRARAGPWTGVLGLDDSALNRATGTWSSGMRQKLSLVRALWAAPDALLLDEPTAHVDPDVVVAVTAALRRAADSGVAVLWATHDLAAAHAICDRIVVLDRTVIREVRGSGEAIRGLSGLA